jgi:hypothetical protein
MTKLSGHSALLCPASVAVHYKGDMLYSAVILNISYFNTHNTLTSFLANKAGRTNLIPALLD